MAKYNQYQKSIFNKLEPIPDNSFHAPLVNKVRNTLHEEQTAIADESEASEEDNEEKI
jgi:hypothetical protein